MANRNNLLFSFEDALDHLSENMHIPHIESSIRLI